MACKQYYVTNNELYSQTFQWDNCQGLTSSTTISPGQTRYIGTGASEILISGTLVIEEITRYCCTHVYTNNSDAVVTLRYNTCSGVYTELVFFIGDSYTLDVKEVFAGSGNLDDVMSNCGACCTYDLNNYSANSRTVTYVDCDQNPQSITLSPSQSATLNNVREFTDNDSVYIEVVSCDGGDCYFPAGIHPLTWWGIDVPTSTDWGIIYECEEGQS